MKEASILATPWALAVRCSCCEAWRWLRLLGVWRAASFHSLPSRKMALFCSPLPSMDHTLRTAATYAGTSRQRFAAALSAASARWTVLIPVMRHSD